MNAYIDQHRDTYGVGPICADLPIAPSTHYEHKAWERVTSRLLALVHRDRELKRDIQRVYHKNLRVYGTAKICLRRVY